MSNIELTPFSTTQGDIRLADYHGQFLVLYFYPKDDTPGCTTEGNDFKARYAEFVENNAKIMGVSRDNLTSHCRFSDKFSFPFPLLVDNEEVLCKHFDVIKQKSLYGKWFMGIERTTLLFAPSGELVKEWRKVKVTGHIDEVLNYIIAQTNVE